jgi:hypothetical protein
MATPCWDPGQFSPHLAPVYGHMGTEGQLS